MNETTREDSPLAALVHAGRRSAAPPLTLPTRLLAWFRDTLRDDRIGYAAPPAEMEGSGAAVTTYRFELSGAPGDLQGPLVLRLYPPGLGVPRALKESAVHGALARHDFPVPEVYRTCTDMSVLGNAFLVMQFRPGELLALAPLSTMLDVLGRTHAALHRLDPEPVAATLHEHGWGASQYGLAETLEALNERLGNRHSGLQPVAAWLLANCPDEPGSPCLCHGDFHPLNILVREDEVTGVLDWSDFRITDPVSDIACTMMVLAHLGRHVLPARDADRAAARYLEAYRARRPVELDHLDYYRVRHALVSLMDVADGRGGMWRDPRTVRGMIAEIYRVTGIAIPEA